MADTTPIQDLGLATPLAAGSTEPVVELAGGAKKRKAKAAAGKSRKSRKSRKQGKSKSRRERVTFKTRDGVKVSFMRSRK